jgi:putative transposase
MDSLDEMINQSRDPRELKRALSVKMGQEGYKPQQISQLLNVSEQYVSKWKGVYEAEGVKGLALGYEGKKPYLAVEQRAEVVNWLKEHPSLRLEELRDYLEERYGVVYQSKQSYYELMREGGLSYHRNEGVNPKRAEAQVLQKRAELKKSWQSIERR